MDLEIVSNSGHYGRLLGFRREVSGELQWLVRRETFLKELGLPSRYRADIEPLFQRGFLETNEQNRGTLKVTLPDRSERFFAVWPDRVRTYWQSVPNGDTLSQFPTFPSGNPEVVEDE